MRNLPIHGGQLNFIFLKNSVSLICEMLFVFYKFIKRMCGKSIFIKINTKLALTLIVGCSAEALNQ